MSTNQQNNDLTNTSTLSFQRLERIKKMKELISLGFDPFSPTSYRDFEISLVDFWFDFVHQFDLKKLDVENDLYILDDFLETVLFPFNLLEHAENILEKRNIAQELGVEPQEVELETSFDDDLIQAARQLFPDLSKYSESQKITLKSKFLKFNTKNDDSNDNEENNENYLNLVFEKNQRITLCGRIKSKKVAGKIAFAKICDQGCPSGFQLVFKKDLFNNGAKIEEIDDLITFFS